MQTGPVGPDPSRRRSSRPLHGGEGAMMTGRNGSWGESVLSQIVIVMCASCWIGCTSPSGPSPREPASIGPQFWRYSLTEYDLAGSDVVSGPGGRWISKRHTLRPGIEVDPASVRERISRALIADSWHAGGVPTPYGLSKVWEQAPSDLNFRRPARTGEPAHWFFSQTIHVSDDARIVCIYAEVGW